MNCSYILIYYKKGDNKKGNVVIFIVWYILKDLSVDIDSIVKETLCLYCIDIWIVMRIVFSSSYIVGETLWFCCYDRELLWNYNPIIMVWTCLILLILKHYDDMYCDYIEVCIFLRVLLILRSVLINVTDTKVYLVCETDVNVYSSKSYWYGGLFW